MQFIASDRSRIVREQFASAESAFALLIVISARSFVRASNRDV